MTEQSEVQAVETTETVDTATEMNQRQAAPRMSRRMRREIERQGERFSQLL